MIVAPFQGKRIIDESWQGKYIIVAQCQGNV